MARSSIESEAIATITASQGEEKREELNRQDAKNRQVKRRGKRRWGRGKRRWEIEPPRRQGKRKERKERE
jgi:hypothetical protein